MCQNLTDLQLLLRLSKASPRQTSGFTLVEVTVGMMLMLIFLGVTTQAFVVSAAFRIRGQELNEATLWIQDDLEDIRFQATNLNYQSGSPGQYPKPTMAGMSDHSARCGAGAGGYGDWLRDEVMSNDENDLSSEVDLDRFSTIGNRPYKLRRVITLSNTNPHVVAIRHAVYALDDVPNNPSETSNPASIATFYSEIIPNASFYCP